MDLKAELEKGAYAAAVSDALGSVAAVLESPKDRGERDAALASRAAMIEKHAALAAAINATRVPRYVDSPAAVIRDALYRLGKWKGVIAAANAARIGADKSETAVICQMLHDMVQSQGTVKITDTATKSAMIVDLNALRAAGIIDSTAADAVLEAMIEDIPMPLALGFGRDLDFNDVLMATADRHGKTWESLALPTFEEDKIKSAPLGDGDAEALLNQPLEEAAP